MNAFEDLDEVSRWLGVVINRRVDKELARAELEAAFRRRSLGQQARYLRAELLPTATPPKGERNA